MELSRRTALASLGVGALSTSLAATASKKPTPTASLAAAVEALRVAMLAGDGKALRHLIHDRIDYMHSSGGTQTKANLLSDLDGKSFFADLQFIQPACEVIGRNGLVKMMVDQVKKLSDGKTRPSRLKVQQVWTRESDGWKLLARSSVLISGGLQPACR